MEREKSRGGAAWFCRFCAGAVAVFTVLLALPLFFASLLHTSDISTGSGFGEILVFLDDSLPLNLAALALCLALLYGFWRLCDRVSLKALTALLLVWTLAAGTAFLCSTKLSPSQDSQAVTFWALQAARGDTSYFHDYYRAFPYQFGYTLYEELAFRAMFLVVPALPEGYACLLLQGGNLVLLCLTQYTLIQILGLLFSSERVQKLGALLLLLSLHGILLSSYLYGIIPGLAFTVLAVWMALLFWEEGRLHHGLLCALFLALAVILKLNYLIGLVAVGLLWLLALARRFSLRSLLCLLLCVAAVLSGKDLPQRYYEKRMGMDFGKGVPIVGWLALGMNEGQTCSGWYDATYTAITFAQSGRDSSKAAQVAWAAVRERMAFFKAEPREAMGFFSRKFLSQWNEPSYEVIWNNNVREHFSPPGRLYTLLCRQGEDNLKTLMNFYQQLILFGFCLSLVRLLRRRALGESLLPLIILGGMLYHLLFEAKSQYAFPYFLMMIPLAGWGLAGLFQRLDRAVRRNG